MAEKPIRSTGPLRPGEQSPGAGVVLVPARSDPPPAGGTGSRVVTTGLVVDLRADVLVDAMSRAVLAHTRASILAGQRPDGGGPQAQLGTRAAAVAGRLTPHRGARTGHLADGLLRTEISGTTASAATTIQPPPDRIVYVRGEAKLGRELITARGAAAAVAERAAEETAQRMCGGEGFAVDRGSREADDV